VKAGENQPNLLLIPDVCPPRFLGPSTAHSAQGQHHRSRWSSLAKPLIGVALAMGVLTAGKAQAFVVNVGGQDWDVTTFQSTYNANTSPFETAANGGVMPWWGSSSLASQFASAVGSNLGEPNCCSTGPGFAYATFNHPPTYVFLESYSTSGGLISLARDPQNDNETWAQAQLVTSSPAQVPAPLPVLGATAAFGYSRQLRKRIKANADTGSSPHSL